MASAGKNVLVLGGAGQLGSVIVDTLNGAGITTLSLDVRANEAAKTNLILDLAKADTENAVYSCLLA